MKLIRLKKRIKVANPLFLLIPILLFSGSFYPNKALAFDLSFGLGAGIRKINDAYLNRVYGSGYVFIPYFELGFSKLFSAELAWEGGYKKEAPIGLYHEPSVLKIAGLEFSICLHHSFKIFAPYLKIGTGYYFYRQDIDSPYVRFRVNHRDISFHGACGLQFKLPSRLYFRIETKYVYLKVKPFEEKVDLGGLRYILSLLYRI